MGGYYTKPVTDKESADESNGKLEYGASSMQGWRPSQEDAHNCILDYDTNTAFFAVYDGHGGHEVAQYCSLKLPDFIKSSQEYKDGDLEQALELGFLRFDATIATPEVVEILKEMALGADDDEASDEEENVNNLYEEAAMPIEQVIEKYTATLAAKITEGDKDKKKKKEEESSDDAVGSSGACSSSTNREEAEQNGEVSTATAEVSSSSQPIENGTKKGKGKKVIKPTPVKTRPKRSAQQLYKNWLDLQDDSEESDEEDKTFEGPNESSEDENDGVNVAIDASEEETSDDEDEEEEEEEISDVSLAFARNMKEEPGSDSGCTAVVALLRDNKLYVANAGDSRCVVCRNGKAVEMSFDHKPEDEPELKRIEKAGGEVTSDGRVNGGLNLSRALGDHAYKQNKDLSDREQMITALPDVKTLTLDSEDEFMVLACDGIWNSMTSQEVVDFVRPRMQETDKLSKICEDIFDNCLAAPPCSNPEFANGNGCDNMTTIIVRFKAGKSKRSASPRADTQDAKRPKTELESTG